MNKSLKVTKFILDFLRCCPHLIIFFIHKNRPIIIGDIERWKKILRIPYSLPITLIYLLSFKRAYRNLFYYRIGSFKYFLNIFCPEIPTLLIMSETIGPGLFFWGGFSTIVGAKSIGKNCMINQMVTIGVKNGGHPTILDNVRINPGAIIFGDITIGNNVIIGANTTVYRDIPDNCSVFAESSKYIKWKRHIDSGTTGNIDKETEDRVEDF